MTKQQRRHQREQQKKQRRRLRRNNGSNGIYRRITSVERRRIARSRRLPLLLRLLPLLLLAIEYAKRRSLRDPHKNPSNAARARARSAVLGRTACPAVVGNYALQNRDTTSPTLRPLRRLTRKGPRNSPAPPVMPMWPRRERANAVSSVRRFLRLSDEDGAECRRTFIPSTVLASVRNCEVSIVTFNEGFLDECDIDALIGKISRRSIYVTF